jgi:hypothetical protein
MNRKKPIRCFSEKEASMTKQFFGIYPWFALIALLFGSRHSAPIAGTGS